MQFAKITFLFTGKTLSFNEFNAKKDYCQSANIFLQEFSGNSTVAKKSTSSPERCRQTSLGLLV